MTVDECKTISLESLIKQGSFTCECGHIHKPGVEKVIIESGAIAKLPGVLREIGCKKPFLLSGHDTFSAAGDKVCSALEQAGLSYSKYVFPYSPVRPTEFTVGSAVMHFDYSCDAIIGIGSGVINDTGKILAKATNLKYIIVATSPSMDGFVSGTSSMDRDGLKVSLYTTAAWGVIGDLDVLCAAPMHMLQAGVGDMLAKIVSLGEWKLANIIVDEYYCPVIAALVETALGRVISSASGLVKRDPESLKAVMEGLIIAGIAMNYAGASRPASGMEHYFSHIWDMRSLAFENAKYEHHGIQAGLGTLYSLKVYEYVRKNVRPNKEKALKYVSDFSLDDWNRKLLDFVGPGAEAMIAGESIEHKYSPEKHALRLQIILDRWDEIKAVMDTLPSYDDVRKLMVSIGEPSSASIIGYDDSQVNTVFTMTKDIRDKYVGSRLLWDLGILEEVADNVF